jgi:hypothetical protein
MAAAIWWRPEGSTVLRKIEIGERFTDLASPVVRDLDVEETMGGLEYRQDYRTRSRLRVVLQDLDDVSLRRELQALCNHLQAGGTCSLAEDDTKACAAFLSVLPVDGTAGLYLYGSPWSELGGPFLEADEVVITSESPRYMQEAFTLLVDPEYYGSGTTASDFGVGVSPALRNDWSGRSWALMRHYGFWPVLRLAKEAINEAAISSSRRRITWTLDLRLDEDIEALEVLAGTPTVTLTGTADSGYPTIEEMREDPWYSPRDGAPTGPPSQFGGGGRGSRFNGPGGG